MYYEVSGESGSPLILIQGLGASKVNWFPPHVERMAAQHRVVIFDNRGVGQTDKPAEPYTMPQFAADTAALLDALDIEKAHVFGVSMGGMIAQHVALEYPERVLGLVLGCTTAGGPGNPQFVSPSDEVIAVLTKPPSGDRAQDIRDVWPILYTPAYVEANRESLESQLQAELAYPEQPPYAFELQMGAIVQTHDTFARLGEINQPTLVQTGLEDLLVPPQNSKILVERIPDARLIEYPGGAHDYFNETGLGPVNDVLAFLEEVDAGKL
jgi:pimeloyl-ACP methyl ester carboxylesterase